MPSGYISKTVTELELAVRIQHKGLFWAVVGVLQQI